MKYIIKTNTLEIDRLYLLRRYKGIGAGTKFLEKAEDILKLNDKKLLTLGVLEINKPAIKFYNKMGFTQYSIDTVIVGKTEYRILLMKKELK